MISMTKAVSMARFSKRSVSFGLLLEVSRPVRPVSISKRLRPFSTSKITADVQDQGAWDIKDQVLTTIRPRLAEKTCLVTGASSGLGRAIAFQYASHGAKHIVCADLGPDPRPGREREKLPTHEVINQTLGREVASFAKCDVGKASDLEQAVKQAVELGGGRLDVIVNNAGVGTPDRWIRLHELDDETWEWIMRINSTGVYYGCKYALAQFMKQGLGVHGRKGWIVNVSSILGNVGISGGAGPYCASKGAVMNLTRQIAADYARDKIHCNALCPGFMATAMTVENYTTKSVSDSMEAATPWGDWGDPWNVAKGAVVLASDDTTWMTGIALPVDGGFLAV